MTIDFAAEGRRHPLAILAARTGFPLADGSGDVFVACPMPEHDDSTPSMLLHLDQDRYHCFGCGATGDVVQWVRDIYGVDTPTALAMLDADRGRFPDRPTGAVSTLRSEVRFAAALIWGLGEEWPCSTASVATYVTLVLAPPLRSTRKRSSCAEPSLPGLTDRIVAKTDATRSVAGRRKRSPRVRTIGDAGKLPGRQHGLHALLGDRDREHRW